MAAVLSAAALVAFWLVVFMAGVPVVGAALYVWTRSVVRGRLSAVRDWEREANQEAKREEG